MPDEIKIDAEKFDRILGRMLNSKPLSKEDIREKIREAGRARKAEMKEKTREYLKKRKQDR
jgi:hypothetical protein